MVRPHPVPMFEVNTCSFLPSRCSHATSRGSRMGWDRVSHARAVRGALCVPRCVPRSAVGPDPPEHGRRVPRSYRTRDMDGRAVPARGRARTRTAQEDVGCASVLTWAWHCNQSARARLRDRPVSSSRMSSFCLPRRAAWNCELSMKATSVRAFRRDGVLLEGATHQGTVQSSAEGRSSSRSANRALRVRAPSNRQGTL